MPIWDQMVEGGPKLPSSAFSAASGFVTDFTKPLNEIFGTQTGWHTRDGQLKNGFYAEHVQSYATGPNNNNSQINGEQQAYLSPNSSAPDPLMMYEKRGTALAVKTRLATPAEQASFAHYRGYHLQPNGNFANESFFLDPANGFGGSIPNNWGAYTIESSGNVLFEKIPARQIGAMMVLLERI